MAADIIITMRRTGTAIQSLMESYARAYDLSPSKIIIIMALASAKNRTLAQGDIARQLAVSTGSLTALMTSLESAGLVRRTVAPDDRPLVPYRAHRKRERAREDVRARALSKRSRGGIGALSERAAYAPDLARQVAGTSPDMNGAALLACRAIIVFMTMTALVATVEPTVAGAKAVDSGGAVTLDAGPYGIEAAFGY